MRQSPILCGAFVAAISLLSFSSTHADTLTFDDLAPGSNYGGITNGYGGFIWNYFLAMDASLHAKTYGPSGYGYSAVSPNNIVFNGFGDTASLQSASDFTFDSAYFTAAWNDGLSVTVTGYNGSAQVDQATFRVNTSGPTRETFDWANITSLTFVSSGGTSHGFSGEGTQFAMDNFTFNATPLPSTAYAGLVLFGGLGCWGLARRRRRCRPSVA